MRDGPENRYSPLVAGGRIEQTDTASCRSTSEGVILLEAAHAVDALAAVRALSLDGKTAGEVNTIQRLEIAWSRQLASLLAQLRTMQSKNYAEPRRCPGCRHRRCYSGAWTADDRLAGRFE